MRSLPLALLWETLWHGRWTLPAFFALGNVLPLLVYGSLVHLRVDPRDPAFIMLQFSFLPLVIFQFAIGIIYAQGPMSRLYTAPISASSIVAWHMASGSVLLGLETAAAAWLYNSLFHVDWPIATSALFAATAWAAFQFLLSVSTRQPLSSICLSSVPGVLLLLWLQSRYGSMFSPPKHSWRTMTASESATMIAAAAVSYGVTVWGVRRTRCGEGLPSLGLAKWLASTWETWTSPAAAELPPFRSPSRAQFWYEWRLKGGGLPIAVALVLLALVTIWLCQTLFNEATLLDLHEAIVAAGGFLSGLALASGLILGMSIGGSHRQREQTLGEVNGHFESMGHFQATRPLLNVQFAGAILKTAAGSLAIAWSLWFAVFLIDLIALSRAHQLPDSVVPARIGAWYLPLTIFGSWLAMTNVAAMGLSGRMKMLTTAIICVAVFAGVLMGLLKAYTTPDMQGRVVVGCLLIASVAIVCVTGWAFFVAYRKRTIGPRVVMTCASVFAGVVLAAIILRPVPLSLVAYFVIQAFAALVVLPLATMPLAIAWNRHR